MEAKGKMFALKRRFSKVQLSFIVVIVVGLVILFSVKIFASPEKVGASAYSSSEYLSDLNVKDALNVEKLKEDGVPILIDFTSTWCIPCKTFNPILESVKNKYKGKLHIIWVNVDEHPAFTATYPIKVLPTQILINADGTPFKNETAPELGFGFTKYSLGDTEHDLTTHEGTFTEEQLLVLFQKMGLQQ